jgi:hypothetical protein
VLAWDVGSLHTDAMKIESIDPTETLQVVYGILGKPRPEPARSHLPTLNSYLLNIVDRTIAGWIDNGQRVSPGHFRYASPLGDLSLRTNRIANLVTGAELHTPTFVPDVPDYIQLCLAGNHPRLGTPQYGSEIAWPEEGQTRFEVLPAEPFKDDQFSAGSLALVDFLTVVDQIIDER